VQVSLVFNSRESTVDSTGSSRLTSSPGSFLILSFRRCAVRIWYLFARTVCLEFVSGLLPDT